MTSDFNDEEEGHVVKLRGLPWSTTVGEIYNFFSDCNIKNGKLGIQMTLSREGRPSGEAYVEMMSEEDVEKACKRDRDHMGHRYIEVFKAKRSEMEYVVKRSGLLVEDSADDACIRLRGLPFGCAKDEIVKFFDDKHALASWLEIVPNGISIPTDYMGRSSGEAYVQFENKDMAEKAMEKHKEKIGPRWGQEENGMGGTGGWMGGIHNRNSKLSTKSMCMHLCSDDRQACGSETGRACCQVREARLRGERVSWLQCILPRAFCPWAFRGTSKGLSRDPGGDRGHRNGRRALGRAGLVWWVKLSSALPLTNMVFERFSFTLNEMV
ncbi:hypothetical protein FOCC_FOCC003509 [Frankliniella occidentalis]|nr:hypothetical protein FOCC_FOCC003509 [Frankliniella occidentalis]